MYITVCRGKTCALVVLHYSVTLCQTRAFDNTAICTDPSLGGANKRQTADPRNQHGNGGQVEMGGAMQPASDPLQRGRGKPAWWPPFSILC